MHPLRSLLHRLLDAVRITRPWSPGLIRGGQGQLPKRIKPPRSVVNPPDAHLRLAASRAVRRLLSRLAAAPLRDAPRRPKTGDSE